MRVPNVPAADRFLFVYPKAGAPKPSRVFHLHGESRHAASPIDLLRPTEISRWNVLRSVARLRRPTSMPCLPAISVIGEGGGGGGGGGLFFPFFWQTRGGGGLPRVVF
eukprot:COSAG01_NODE_4454_length_5006_cov_27.029550_7_plen_107_part_01